MGCKLTAVPVPRSQVLDRPYLGGLNLPILVAAGRADRSTQKNSRRLASGHLTTVAKQFRDARRKAALPESLVLYCARHTFGNSSRSTVSDRVYEIHRLDEGFRSTTIAYSIAYSGCGLAKGAI